MKLSSIHAKSLAINAANISTATIDGEERHSHWLRCQRLPTRSRISLEQVMTQDQQTILMFKGLIASLPEESQAKVKQAEKVIRQLLTDYPDGEATIALGLVGAELQCDGPESVTK